MMEFGRVDDLDDDFITLWSRHLLDFDYDKFDEELEILAKAGQCNAVIKWYHGHEINECPQIDEIVRGYGRENYNELYAKAVYCAVIPEYLELFGDLNDQFYETFDKLQKDNDNSCFETLNHLEKRILNLPVINFATEAYEQATRLGTISKNFILLEWANEILASIVSFLPFENDRKEGKRKVENTFNSLFNSLMKEYYRKVVKKNKDVKSEPLLCFALAKSILYSSREDKELAMSILKSLASRQYSYMFAIARGYDEEKGFFDE